jgi:hydrogenase expression/formation protein HypC
MCIALPAKIKDLNGSYAVVSIMEIESEVNIALIDNPKLGEYILVHAGCGIQKIEESYFHEIQELMKEWTKIM